jgi:hypothetical protein
MSIQPSNPNAFWSDGTTIAWTAAFNSPSFKVLESCVAGAFANCYGLGNNYGRVGANSCCAVNEGIPGEIDADSFFTLSADGNFLTATGSLPALINQVPQPVLALDTNPNLVIGGYVKVRLTSVLPNDPIEWYLRGVHISPILVTSTTNSAGSATALIPNNTLGQNSLQAYVDNVVPSNMITYTVIAPAVPAAPRPFLAGLVALLGIGGALLLRRRGLAVVALLALALEVSACSSSPNDAGDSGALNSGTLPTDAQAAEVAQDATDATVDSTPEAPPIAHCCRRPPPMDPNSLEKCDVLARYGGVTEPCTPNNVGGYGDWSCGALDGGADPVLSMCSDNGRSCEIGADCEFGPGDWGCHGTVVPCNYPWGDDENSH